MIDLQQLRADPARARASQRARGEDDGLVDGLLAADEARRSLVAAADQQRAEANAASKAIGASAPDERPARIEQARVLKEQVKDIEAQEAAAEEALRAAHLALPNIVEAGVPPGGEDDYA